MIGPETRLGEINGDLLEAQQNGSDPQDLAVGSFDRVV
jgi:hypothetical protein